MLTYMSLTANLTFVAAVAYLELFVYCKTEDSYFESGCFCGFIKRMLL